MKSEAERLESKAIRELRKKNQRLALEVRKLRKMLRQAERAAQEDIEEVEDEVTDEFMAQYRVTVPPEPKKPACPRCRSSEDCHVFELLEKDYFKCGECGAKGRYTE